MSINDKTLSWHSYGLSDVGKVRKYNEDAMLERPEVGTWVIADGMGGHSAGDVASQAIINSLKTIQKTHPLDEYIDHIESHLLDVNQQLIEKARQLSIQATIGSTVVIFVTYGKYCVYLWAGDSRLYRLREGKLGQMTTDHSQVEHYIKQGLITREEAITYPYKNLITRAVGANENFFLDMDIQEIQKGDRYLLCSDGLTKHIVDIEFQDILQEGTTKETCHKLIEISLSRGAGDNVTAIIIDITD